MAIDWENLEIRAARWANILACLPGTYCAYVLWEQRHPGGTPLSQYPGFTFSVVAFLSCIVVAAILNFLRRSKGVQSPPAASPPWKDKAHWKNLYDREHEEKVKIEGQIEDVRRQIKLNENQCKKELENSQEAYRQCMLERGAAIDGAKECMAKLSLFTPLQLEAFLLSKEIRDLLDEAGSYPDKSAYGYDTERAKFPDRQKDLHDYWDARHEIDKRIALGYQRKFDQKVKDFLCRIGEAGYPISSTDWTPQIQNKNGFLKLAADLETTALWFNRNKYEVSE